MTPSNDPVQHQTLRQKLEQFKNAQHQTMWLKFGIKQKMEAPLTCQLLTTGAPPILARLQAPYMSYKTQLQSLYTRILSITDARCT